MIMFNVFTYQTCNWTAITYPESFDHEELAKRFIYARIPFSYILHDQDTWCEDDDLPEGVSVGDLKKPHIHWCIRFPSKKSGKVVCTIVDKNRVLPMRKDPALDYRYLCHLDDPDKYQYPPSDIVTNEPEFCEPYLYDLQDTSEVCAHHLLDSIRDLYAHSISYVEFYTRHPDMMRKAGTVETLLRQVGSDIYYFPAVVQVSRDHYSSSKEDNRPKLSQNIPDGTF